MRYFISKNLAKPGRGIWGYIVSKHISKTNKYLEQAAVQLCDIEPDHHVLELGYGPGLGLKAAFTKVAEGSGTVHGVDFSRKMFNVARRNLATELNTGKIHIHLASVTELPYPDSTFDSIFHCNCYYFRPDMDHAVKELHRVLKPDRRIVATMHLKRMEELRDKGYMQFGNTDSERYMGSLERKGFADVFMKDIKTDDKQFNAIYATAVK